MRRLGLAVAMVLGASIAARAAHAAGPTYAIVVGHNGGGAGLPELRFADDDAVRFALFFRGLDAADRPSRVWLLADLDAETEQGLAQAGILAPPHGSPTRGALDGAFDEVRRALEARPDTSAPAVLYVLYAGHGLGGRILLKPEGASEAAITGHEIRAAVAALASSAPALQTFLFIDACRSQSLFTERGGDREIGPDLSAQASDLERRAGTVRIGVLTAAAAGKSAGEVRDLGAGYFSHVLASGLAGAADADGDDVVSFGELAAFVAFNTERFTGQRPWFSPPGGDLGAPAIDHRGRRTRLELTGVPAGRYLVEASPGRPIFAEAYKGDRRPLRLALPPGRYRVLRAPAADGHRARRAEVELIAGQRLDLAGAAWDDETLPDARAARGEDDPHLAFEATFTPEAVSTLTAGYHAGREPAAAAERLKNDLGVAIGVGTAPLGLGGAEPAAALRYRRALGSFFLGGRASFARSSHAIAGSYDLERYLALLEAGARLAVGRRLELSAAASVGAGMVVRRGAAGGTSGDPLVPTIGAAGGIQVRIAGAWHASLELRYAVQWIQIDGVRRGSGDPAGELGVGLAF